MLSMKNSTDTLISDGNVIDIAKYRNKPIDNSLPTEETDEIAQIERKNLFNWIADLEIKAYNLQKENNLLKSNTLQNITLVTADWEGDNMIRINKIAMIPYFIFSAIFLCIFAFSLAMHFSWRVTGIMVYSPETSYLLTLTSFGLLATSVTGLVVRGKHGIGKC